MLLPTGQESTVWEVWVAGTIDKMARSMSGATMFAARVAAAKFDRRTPLLERDYIHA